MDFVLSFAGEWEPPGPPYACEKLGFSVAEDGSELMVARVVTLLDTECNSAYPEVLLALHMGNEPLSKLSSWPGFVYVLVPLTALARVPGNHLKEPDYLHVGRGEIYPSWTLSELKRIHALPNPERMTQLAVLTRACQAASS